MPYFLIVQYPYETIDIALCENQTIIVSKSLHKYEAVGQTIPTIQQILLDAQLSLGDIACIGVNVGPGPYNTLRGLLTMINGIHTVTKVPLAQLNALDLLSQQLTKMDHIIMLQAFENHVFYKIKTDAVEKHGAGSIEELTQIVNQQSKQLHCHGNGAIKYKAKLSAACPEKLIFDDKIEPFNSIEFLAKETYEKYNAQTFAIDYLRPLYFEDMNK